MGGLSKKKRGKRGKFAGFKYNRLLPDVYIKPINSAVINLVDE